MVYGLYSWYPRRNLERSGNGTWRFGGRKPPQWWCALNHTGFAAWFSLNSKLPGVIWHFVSAIFACSLYCNGNRFLGRTSCVDVSWGYIHANHNPLLGTTIQPLRVSFDTFVVPRSRRDWWCPVLLWGRVTLLLSYHERELAFGARWTSVRGTHENYAVLCNGGSPGTQPIRPDLGREWEYIQTTAYGCFGEKRLISGPEGLDLRDYAWFKATSRICVSWSEWCIMMQDGTHHWCIVKSMTTTVHKSFCITYMSDYSRISLVGRLWFSALYDLQSCVHGKAISIMSMESKHHTCVSLLRRQRTETKGNLRIRSQGYYLASHRLLIQMIMKSPVCKAPDSTTWSAVEARIRILHC